MTTAAARELAVIMPAYNEAGNIARTVGEVQAAVPSADVIVINDGSHDGTGALARAAGALVMDLPHNLGIGGAVQTGYKFAAERGYRVVARLDGDGQHDPTQLGTLLAPILAGQADVVIGSRFVGGPADDASAYRASRARAGGIRFFAAVVSLIIRQRVTDTTSGFQACTAEVATFFSRHFPTDYPEVESVAALGRSGYRILEVPVRMRVRAAGRSSITPLRSAYYALKVTVALGISLLRRPAPRTLPAVAVPPPAKQTGRVEAGAA